MTATATAARTSRKLPAGWTSAGPGRAIHHETGTEVIKTGCGWKVCVPGRPGPEAHPGTVQIISEFFPTRAAAIQIAEEGTPLTPAERAERGDDLTHWLPVITHTRQLIAQCWDEAHFANVGRPSTWPLGEASAEIVAERRRAVAATGTPTGLTADEDQLVVHIVTGTPGRLHGTITYDRPFHALDAGTYAAVTFASNFPFPVPVHPDDVVAITDTHLYCRRPADEEHAEHVDVEGPMCLIEMPDAELEGPALEETGDDDRYRAVDGVEVHRDADGTWAAHGPAMAGGYTDKICTGEPTLGRTYRPINQWRAVRALQHRIIDAYATLCRWSGAEVRLAEIRAELGEINDDDYVDALLDMRHVQLPIVLLGLEPGTEPTAADVEAAIIVDGRERYTISLLPDYLARWAETNRRTPTVDGRAVFWRDGKRLRYRDTGRAVHEPMPTHVIIHVITDRAAYAGYLLADAERGNPSFRDGLIRLAAEVADGTRPARAPYVEHFTDQASAEQYARDLRRNHDYPGKAYEVVPVAATGACEHCHQPVLLIDGTWRHHLGRFPIDCGDTFDGQPHAAALKGSDPGQDGAGQDVIQTPTQTQTPDRAAAVPPAAPGQDGGSQDRLVAFGFRIQTQTGSDWTTVRTGFTPPLYRPDPDLLNAVAADILSNLRSVLRLGPRDAVPTARVQTWHTKSGLTGLAVNS